ncbi:MAG TPA: phosphoribosyltransferase, partial [Candidatus Nitrosotenuis sp.]|nr:phosphoribosyltransferase [Candidatus Nitrosotenuis sp.]
GTTTAQTVLTSLGINGSVSSSMPQNPISIKQKIAMEVAKRTESKNQFDVVSNGGDPMIPTVAGILSTASYQTKVILAGGTQMAAVLAFSRITGYNKDNVALATTSYVTDDKSANLVEMIKQIDEIPIFSVRLALGNSKIDGLRSFAKGFVKEGVGAGGATLAAMLKIGITADQLLELTEKQYREIISQ